jgi:hypothetical protein
MKEMTVRQLTWTEAAILALPCFLATLAYLPFARKPHFVVAFDFHRYYAIVFLLLALLSIVLYWRRTYRHGATWLLFVALVGSYLLTTVALWMEWHLGDVAAGRPWRVLQAWEYFGALVIGPLFTKSWIVLTGLAAAFLCSLGLNAGLNLRRSKKSIMNGR